MFKRILIWAAVLVVIGLLVLYFGRNWLVEQAVEEGSTYAVGVQTDLGSASLNIGGGSLGLSDYTISNPEGFDGDRLFHFSNGQLAVQTGSVFDNEVIIDSLIIEGIDVNLQQINDKGNYLVILDHIKQQDLGQSSKSERKYRVQKLAIRDINVSASLNLLEQKKYEKTYAVDDITLTDIGSDGGVSIGQIAARVIREVLTKAVQQGKGQLPDQFGAALGGFSLDRVKESGEDVVEDLKEAGKSLLGGNKEDNQ